MVAVPGAWPIGSVQGMAGRLSVYCGWDFFFFFFCGQSAVLRPSVHMLPGIWWCITGLPPFPTACWWLTHPAAITGVSVSARWDSRGECGGPSVLLTSLICNFCLSVAAHIVGYMSLFLRYTYVLVRCKADNSNITDESSLQTFILECGHCFIGLSACLLLLYEGMVSDQLLNTACHSIKLYS